MAAGVAQMAHRCGMQFTRAAAHRGQQLLREASRPSWANAVHEAAAHSPPGHRQCLHKQRALHHFPAARGLPQQLSTLARGVTWGRRACSAAMVAVSTRGFRAQSSGVLASWKWWARCRYEALTLARRPRGYIVWQYAGHSCTACTHARMQFDPDALQYTAMRLSMGRMGLQSRHQKEEPPHAAARKTTHLNAVPS